MHGLLDSSFSWFANKDPKLCLPYILCDLGLDVWILNNRGNRFSIGHEFLKNLKNNRVFWDFSFDEIAKYDVPANVLYIKSVTMCEKVVYIGHSQGTTQLFAHLTLNPEF